MRKLFTESETEPLDNRDLQGKLITYVVVGAGIVFISISVVAAAFFGSPSNGKPPPTSSPFPFLGAIIVIVIALSVILFVVAFVYFLHKRRSRRAISYSMKISELTSSLRKASAEVDRILAEMAQIVQERESAISALKQKETELQSKIDSLEKVPVEAAEFFTKYLEKQDKKSWRRDLILFALAAFLSMLGIVFGVLGVHLFGH